jgi:hypothetical protein
MANVNCLIVNPTATAYTDVNAGGQDVPAYSCGAAGADGTPTTGGFIAVLSDAEMATFAAAHPTALILICASSDESADPVNEVRRLAAKILKLGRLPGSSSLVQ